MNWIDTPAAYGFGRSETVVGRALAQVQSGTLTIMVGGDEQA